MIYAFDRCELDTELYELRRDGALVAVQPKVLSLLTFLLRNRERTVPKQELFTSLWPGEHVGETSLTKAVRGARLVIGDPEGRRLRSVRAIGYRFVGDVVEREHPDPARAPSHEEAPAASLAVRAQLSQRLERMLAEARAGRGALALLVGPPGIGKTRTLDAFAARARALGAAVFTGACRDEQPPFWPFVQVVRAFARERSPEALRRALGSGASEIAQAIPELARLLPDVAAPPAIEPTQERFRLHDSVGLFLRHVAAERPLVLALDDLHWADSSTLRLLEFLARELRDAPVLLLGAYRDAQPLDETRASALDALGRAATSLELAGLTPDDVARLIELETGRHPEPALVTSLHERTGGNPLFVTELLAVESSAREARGRLAKGVRDAIARHLEVISPAARATLRIASVLGTEFSLRPLSLACGRPAADVLAELGEAVRARVLAERAETPGRYAFSHALIPEVLHAELDSAERTRLHGVTARALLLHYGDHVESHLSEVAHHLLLAAPTQDAGLAVEFAERAAQRAYQQTAYEEAARFWLRARAAVEQTGGDAARGARLLLQAAEAQLLGGDLDRARVRFREVAARARELDDGELFARAALGMQALDETGNVDVERASLLEEALRRLPPGDGTLRVRVLASLSKSLYFADPPERCLELSREAVAMARRIGDRPTLAAVLRRHLFALARDEMFDERAAGMRDLVAVVEETGDAELRAETAAIHVQDCLARGDRAGIEQAMAEHERIARETRQPYQLWYAKQHRAMLALLSGRFDVAERLVPEALADGRRIQQELAFEWAGVQLFILRREQGRAHELEPFVRALAERYPLIATWRAALALVDLDAGRTGDARAGLRGLVDADLAAIRRDLNWLITLAVLAELCAELGDAESAEPVARALRPYEERHISIGRAVAGYGPVSRYLGLAAGALGRYDDAERFFERALEACDRAGAHPFAAHVRHEFARVLLATGDRVDRARARELAAAALAAAEQMRMRRLARLARSVRDELDGAIALRPRRA